MGLLQAIKAAISGKRGPVETGPRAGIEATAEGVPAVLAVPRRILFVESDPATRDLLGACLPALAERWPSQVVVSVGDGLAELGKGGFEGLVVSSELEGGPGIDFLERARQLVPSIATFMLSTPEQRTELSKRPGLPPHFLAQPPTASELSDALERGFLLNRWMDGAAARPLLTRMTNLPAVPSLYARVMRELRSDDPSIDAVGKLIAQDPALTAKILQMVNSPVFALGRPICEAVDAVTFLGAERTKALILMASLSLHGSLTPCDGFSQESFWQHSLAVATIGRLVGLKELKSASIADTCFTAGLLHDIGKLLFASNLPKEYGEVIAAAKAKAISVHQAELEAFGVTHGELGASLLGTWGLPMTVLEAIAWHEHPSAANAPGYSAVTVVHVANVLEYEKRGGAEHDGAPQFETSYLQSLDLAERPNAWRALVGCPARSESADKAA